MRTAVLLLALLAAVSTLSAQYVEVGEGGTLMLAAPFCGA